MQSHYQQGEQHYVKKEYQKAIDCYTHSIEKNEDLLRATFHRGIAYASLKQWTLAKEDFEAALCFAMTPN